MQYHRLFGIALSSLVATAVLATGALAAEPLRVGYPQTVSAASDANLSRVLPLMVDFASILRVEGEMSAIAVGNPEIADASLADQRTVIVTGRMAGTTNLIALNHAGEVIADVTVRVTSRKPGAVTVRRGTQIEAYGCTSPNCDGTAGEPAAQAPALVIADTAG